MLGLQQNCYIYMKLLEKIWWEENSSIKGITKIENNKKDTICYVEVFRYDQN